MSFGAPHRIAALALLLGALVVSASARGREPRTAVWYSAGSGQLWVIATTGGESRSYYVSHDSFQAHVAGELLILRFDRERRALRLVTGAGTATRGYDESAWSTPCVLRLAGLLLASDRELFRAVAAEHQELEAAVAAIGIVLASPSRGDVAALDRAVAHLPRRTRTCVVRSDLALTHEGAAARR